MRQDGLIGYSYIQGKKQFKKTEDGKIDN